MAATWAVAAVLLASPGAAKDKGYKANFFGDHGGTQPATTGPAAQYLEETPPVETLSSYSQTPPAEAAPRGPAEAAPVTARALSLRPVGAFVPRDPATRRYIEREAAAGAPAPELKDAVAEKPSAAPASPKAFSLWESASAPSGDLDGLRGRAEDDYDKRVLGVEPARRSGEVAAMPGASVSRGSAQPGELFVAVELSVRDAGTLRDAVADLSRVSGFKPDPRFAAEAAVSEAESPSGARRVAVRGWLPAARIGQAATAPGVTRLEIEKGAPAERADAAVASMLVGLRIPAQASAAETFQRVVRELGESAKLRWTRTIGFQSLPNTPDAALIIVADVPVTRIPKVLEHPAVLKVAPAPAPEPEAPIPAKRSVAARFMGYVRDHAPFLMVLTLLALLPSAASLLRRLGRAL